MFISKQLKPEDNMHPPTAIQFLSHRLKAMLKLAFLHKDISPPELPIEGLAQKSKSFLAHIALISVLEIVSSLVS